MQTIKKISGNMLLYFYAIQRNKAFSITEFISFSGIRDEQIKLDNRDKSPLLADLYAISKSDADIYNAMIYLEEKSFISFKTSMDSGGHYLHDVRVTAYGIDIIESIERKDEDRENFYVNFNIEVSPTINVESLLKVELEQLVKNSLF